MNKLVLFNSNDLITLLKTRPSETKFGQHIQLLPTSKSIYEDLRDLDVDYVIFGIKDDVGVFANHGKSNTSIAWEATLKVLLNIQSNAYTNPKKVLILGHLDFSKFNKKLKTYSSSNKKDIQKARKKVELIDQHVTELVHLIIKAGKTPIVIGGGHNNAYGNIKGTALALKQPVNAINFDAHTDFRAEEGRHSGNGFSYAFAEGFLKNYFIFGLHENYTSDAIFKTIAKLKAVRFNTFEALSIRKTLKFKTELKRALQHVNSNAFGIEIDCDAIENISSSAMSPSGFRLTQARQFVHFFGSHKNAAYLHICEASPTPENESQIGKLITYLITDFIRAHGH